MGGGDRVVQTWIMDRGVIEWCVNMDTVCLSWYDPNIDQGRCIKCSINMRGESVVKTWTTDRVAIQCRVNMDNG